MESLNKYNLSQDNDLITWKRLDATKLFFASLIFSIGPIAYWDAKWIRILQENGNSFLQNTENQLELLSRKEYQDQLLKALISEKLDVQSRVFYKLLQWMNVDSFPDAIEWYKQNLHLAFWSLIEKYWIYPKISQPSFDIQKRRITYSIVFYLNIPETKFYGFKSSYDLWNKTKQF